MGEARPSLTDARRRVATHPAREVGRVGVRVDGPAGATDDFDWVAVEEPLEIRASGPGQGPASVAVTMRTPGADLELAVGFLRTEGLIGPDDAVVEADCWARGGVRAAQRAFDRTGGLHAAGLFDAGGGLLAVREDVGRHNAVDKVVGRAFLDGELPLSGRILMVSGRTSFEILQKAAAAGAPIVCAVSAPSSLAISVADRLGITLVGFLRGDRFNIYSHPGRIAPGADR